MLQVLCFQLSGSQVTANDGGDLGQLEPTVPPGKAKRITLLLEPAVCRAGLTGCLELHQEEQLETGDSWWCRNANCEMRTVTEAACSHAPFFFLLLQMMQLISEIRNTSKQVHKR